jgi:OmpA-OmpF porin, OOP family
MKMSVNLLDIASAATGGNFAGALGQFLGESPSVTSSGLSAVLPALLGGLVSKGATAEGANGLLSMLNTPQIDSGILGSLGSMFGNGNAQASGLVSLGSTLLGSMFGDKVGGLASAIASVAGLKGSSATSLLGLAVPIVLGMLKSHVGQNNLNPSGLMDLLKGQGQHLSGKIDPRVSTALGFPSVAGLLGLGGSAVSQAASAVTGAGVAAVAGAGAAAAALGGKAASLGAGVASGVGSGAAAATAVAAKGGSSLMRWLPWLIGAAVLAWALSGMRGCGQAEKVAVPAPAAPVVSAPAATPAPTPAPAPAADPVKPAAVATAKPDPAKIYFASGKFDPPADLAQKLDALVVYSRADTNAKLSISGFHDKTGNAEANIELAKSRAMGVKNALISAGVPEDRIMMQKPTETVGGGDDKEARRVEVAVAQ